MMTLIVNADAFAKDLDRLGEDVEKASERALDRIGALAARYAHDNLTGARRTAKVRMRARISVRQQDGNREVSVSRRTRRRGQSDALGARPGTYPPVPRVTGWLASSQGYVPPGTTVKTKGGQTVRAGRGEVIIYNSAQYAHPIHEGGHTSKSYGRRPFQEDGAKKALDEGHITFREEIEKIRGAG